VGKDWLEQVHYAMHNFRDDSFILQYLSPKVIRDMKLFVILDDEDEDEYEIKAIHNERGYYKVKEALSEQYKRTFYVPEIQVERVDLHSTNKLHLIHNIFNDRKLEQDETQETLENLRYLWEFPVQLSSRNKLGINEETFECS
jgi:spore cortex formation protein SpoVR/YcgB (stage V sporulation)